MKFLPFTISVGKSLDRMLNEKLTEEDLAYQIERMQERGNKDSAVKRGFRSLPLREILYKDFQREGRPLPHDVGRMIIRAYECGINFPNCHVTSEDEIHYDKDSTQRQAVISEDILLVREIWQSGYGTNEPCSKVISCFIKPFSDLESPAMDYSMAEAFTREVFDRPIDLNFSKRIGSIGGSRDDKDFGRPVYEIRLIVPSESRIKYSCGLWRTVRHELDKLGYKKLEEPLCLA